MSGIKELRKICQKSEYAPSWQTQSIEGRINRIFSIYFTHVFIHTPITPNQITALGTIFYLSGVSLFIFGRVNFYIIGLILMFISFILDACDGEVARYKKSAQGGNIGGAYVEPVSHDIMYAFYFLPIGIGQSLILGNRLPLIATLIATVSKLLFRLAEFWYDAMQRIVAEKQGKTYGWLQYKKAPTNIFYLIYRNFFTGTGMFFVLIIAVLIGHIDWYLYFYASGFFMIWIYKMLRQWKRIRKL